MVNVEGPIVLLRFMIAMRAAVVAYVLVAALAATPARCRAQDILSGGPALAPTRLELYGGYAYFHPLGGTIATRHYATINPGAVSSVTGYFNRTFGVQLEGGASPNGPNDSVYTLQAGPVVRYSYGRFTPFAHALGGVARVRGPSLQPPTYGWGLTGGVGLDYVLPVLRRRIAIRPIQADYEFTHVDYGKLAANGFTGGLGEIKAYRLSAGVLLRFGGGLPRERPLVYACSASPSEVFAGDSVTVTGSSTGPATRNRSIYTWQVNGGTWEVSGGRVAVTDNTAVITTVGLAPGNYNISGHLSQGRSAGENATCTESFTVLAPVPPTISCLANPVSVRPGGRATITSIASSRQDRPLTFSYSASAGQIASTSAAATLDTKQASAGPITVTCQVSDDLGQVARATTVVNVSAPPGPVAARRSLCPLSFERDRKRPVRVDNEAKACLDDVALALNREPDAKLEITGESSADENAGQATARASNARVYLTQEKGIDPLRVAVKTGTLASRTAEIELIPVGTPVRYSNLPLAPTAPKPMFSPSPRQDEHDGPAPATPAPPSYEGSGSAVPRRSAESLVLPPLPAAATSSTKSGAKHRTGLRRHRHRKPATAVGSSDAIRPTPPIGASAP